MACSLDGPVSLDSFLPPRVFRNVSACAKLKKVLNLPGRSGLASLRLIAVFRR